MKDLKSKKLIDKTMTKMLKEYDTDTEFVLLISIERDGAPIIQPYTLFCDGTRPTQMSADDTGPVKDNVSVVANGGDGTDAVDKNAESAAVEIVNVCASSTCQISQDLKLCSRCKKVSYCSAKCQRDCWKLHKVVCKAWRD